VICENGGVVRFSYDGEDIVLGNKEKCIKALEELKKHFSVDLLDFEYRKSEVCMRRNFDLQMAREILKDFDVRLLDSGFAYHISDRNVSKGKALEFISDRLGIPVKGFAVVGDSENDIDMFRVAGFRIAVANADIRLKELADLVTPSNDGDGVIEALEFLRLI
jgi:phosphoglycolate phosphatase (TIGR01487 family)